jgi:hypothetical protein
VGQSVKLPEEAPGSMTAAGAVVSALESGLKYFPCPAAWASFLALDMSFPCLVTALPCATASASRSFATAFLQLIANQDDLETDLLKSELIAGPAQELHRPPRGLMRSTQLHTDGLFSQTGERFLHLPVKNERDIGVELLLKLEELKISMLPSARFKHRQHEDILLRVMDKGIQHTRSFETGSGRRSDFSL